MSDDGLLESLVRLPELANPTASPSGDMVAFYYDATGRNELHVLDVATGEREQWSDGEVPRSNRWPVAWSADGDCVFFHRDEGGDEQNDVFAIARDGTVEPVLETDGQTNVHDVGTDGETLLVTSNHEGQMNLYRHDLPTNETTRITDHDRQVWEAHLSPGSDRVAYATNESDAAGNRDVYVVGIDGSDPRKLDVGATGAEATPEDWGPEGDRLLVSDDTENLNRCGVYDLATDEVRWYGDDAGHDDCDCEESPACFTPDGERFLATRTRDATVAPVVYDVESGQARELDLPDGVASFGWRSDRVLGDDRVLVTHTTPTRRTELLAYDLETDEYESLFERDYGAFSPADFTDAEYFTVESDGVPATRQAAVDHDPYETLEIGALLYDSGERPSPLLVNPHGGPRRASRKAFHYRTQFLVRRGFSVLQVNYRGSAGRGREFAEALYGDWGGAEQGDVATVVEHVLSAYEWIDEDRVGIFGGSYGGYSTYWQLVQYPDLYDAGAVAVGMTDLVDVYENAMAHFRTGLLEKYLGTPEENPDLYRERSPIKHAENLDASLLITHRVNDSRVPVSQAHRFRDALEEHGYREGKDGDFEYREFGDAGHHNADVDQRIRSLRLFDEFLDRRLD